MPKKDVRKSAVKTFKQSEKARLRHKACRNTIWTMEKNLRSAVASGSKSEAEELLRGQYAALDKAVKSGAMHKNKCSRKKARLGALVSGTAVKEIKPSAEVEAPKA